MAINWDFTAQTYLDQLPAQEQARVVSAVNKLPSTWSRLEGTQLVKVPGSALDLFSLQVGGDLRVLLQRRGNTITVVDVVRRSQIEGLRHLEQQRQAAAG